MDATDKCANTTAALRAPARRLFCRARNDGLRRAALVTALALIAPASASGAAKCNQSVADLYDSKSPAVVLVTALTINPYRTDDRVRQATGSGFIIDAKGLIMTNSHVVFGAQAITVTLDDGTALPARLLGADPIFDIAILKIPEPEQGKLVALVFGDSDRVRPGDEVIAIGNPLGLEQTVTHGIVSGLNRVLPDRPRLLSWPMIQTDAAINPGNSGGPLLNRCGEVIGITSEILGDAQNIGFAIPSNLARSVMTPLAEKGKLARPWFGVDGSLIDSELTQIFRLPLTEGFLVESVEPSSPADLAGIVGGHLPVKVENRSLILGGDVIVAINGIALTNDQSLQRALDTLQIGGRARLKVFRKGKIFATELAITERPLQPGDVPESPQSFSIPQNQGSDGAGPR